MSQSDENVTISDQSVEQTAELVEALQLLRLRAGDPSLRTLANRINDSGETTVSHSTMGAVFSGRRLPTWPVVKATVRVLGGNEDRFKSLWMSAQNARRAASAAEPGDYFSERYLRLVKAFSRQLTLPSPTIPSRVDLDYLYIEQRVTELDDDHEITLMWLDDQQQRFVLLGEPGTGKTTACHALMYRHAVEPHRPIPFLITVRDFFSAVPPGRSVVSTIEHTVETFFQTPPPSGYIEELLTSGEALIIFDGLDELSAEAARLTSSVIELFCAEFPQVRVVVTSRPVGYATASLNPALFKTFRLSGLDEVQIRDYVTKLFALQLEVPRGEAKNQAELWLRQSAFIADLRSNPLFLSFALQLYMTTGMVPVSVVGVIQGMADLLVLRWDYQRGIGPEPLRSDVFKRALNYIAFWMLDNEVYGLAEPEILRQLPAFFEEAGISSPRALLATRDFLETIQIRSWMFSEVGITQAGAPIYSFTYRTFMEFFAASHLASEQDPAGLIAPRLTKPGWQAVFALLLELWDQRFPDGAQQLFNEVRQLTQGLDERALESARAELDKLTRFDGPE